MGIHKRGQLHAKIGFSIAALLFFAPLVEKTLKTTHLDFSKQELSSIKSYISLGYIGYSVVGGLFLLQLTNSFLQSEFIEYIIGGVCISSLLAVGISIASLFSDKRIAGYLAQSTRSQKELQKHNEQRTVNETRVLTQTI